MKKTSTILLPALLLLLVGGVAMAASKPKALSPTLTPKPIPRAQPAMVMRFSGGSDEQFESILNSLSSAGTINTWELGKDLFVNWTAANAATRDSPPKHWAKLLVDYEVFKPETKTISV